MLFVIYKLGQLNKLHLKIKMIDFLFEHYNTKPSQVNNSLKYNNLNLYQVLINFSTHFRNLTINSL